MQPVPEGYMPLDFVGFTDRGQYSPGENYVENDIVHKDNTAWRCLIDNTIGVAPAEGENWTVFMDGTGAFYGAYDTFPIPGDPGRFYVDDTVDPRLMYTWDTETQKYILTGGAGGADGSSVDIPITLTSTGWTGEAPYRQTVTVPQMREGMTPLFFLASDGDDAQYAFSLLTGYEAGYAEITFYSADIPAVDMDLILKGIPAQELEYVDNTVVFLVEPSIFTLNDTTQRYEATIPVEGMTEGTGGVWDIVRSGPVLTDAESRIALSVTDVDRMDGAVKIVCLEVPAQRYMMSIAGAYPDAEPGTVILSGMQEWFDRVDQMDAHISSVTEKTDVLSDRGIDLLQAFYPENQTEWFNAGESFSIRLNKGINIIIGQTAMTLVQKYSNNTCSIIPVFGASIIERTNMTMDSKTGVLHGTAVDGFRYIRALSFS